MKLKIKIPEKIGLALTRGRDKRYIVFIGGRGGGKSWAFSDIFVSMAENAGHKIGCLREYQNSIEDSVYSLIKRRIEAHKIQDRFNILKSYIECPKSGGLFRFKGFSRDSSAIKSYDGFNIFWIEEGQTLSHESIRDIFPTLREAGSQIWISANPMSAMDPFSERFIKPYKDIIDRDGFFEDDRHLIVKINYCDNPWFPDVLEAERQADFRELDRAEYDHKWLGEFLDTIEQAIIKREWFDACVDAHKKLGFEALGARIVAHDPADTGGDSKGLCFRHGNVIKDVKYLDNSDVNVGCSWALDYALKVNADDFVWDCDGIGLGLQKQVSDKLSATKVTAHMFKGSNSPDEKDQTYITREGVEGEPKTNREMFRNKRAQHAWKLRDKIYNTYLAVEKKKYIDPADLISVSSNIKELDRFRSEVCRVPRILNTSGLIQIMSKKDMARLKIESPGGFDSAMMSMITPAAIAQIQKTPITFPSLW